MDVERHAAAATLAIDAIRPMQTGTLPQRILMDPIFQAHLAHGASSGGVGEQFTVVRVLVLKWFEALVFASVQIRVFLTHTGSPDRGDFRAVA
jgi:hypothetical protein